MKSVFASVAAALLLASSSVAQLMVNTPLSVVVCQPTLLSWTAGTPPYFLRYVQMRMTCDNTLISPVAFSPTTLSLTWIANFSVGTTLGLNLRDTTGTLVQSAPFTIQSGSDLSCLNASGSSSSSSGSAGSAPPTTAPATTPTTPATTPVTPPPATTPTSPAATTPKHAYYQRQQHNPETQYYPIFGHVCAEPQHRACEPAALLNSTWSLIFTVISDDVVNPVWDGNADGGRGWKAPKLTGKKLIRLRAPALRRLRFLHMALF
ncbi:hypothetical protein GALMADRAFT_156343 [Galerina marginata CBS 339.88]|uniref:Uncharacterized protein n=1 Tax=Galerina marginata (strain CBS 339.88) TaxID=685588 RepID=A0A067TB59_GALM3|nr:hypothetical protein GALMADRAFT_156343 [Galerina marginata CBS 339.88]